MKKTIILLTTLFFILMSLQSVSADEKIVFSDDMEITIKGKNYTGLKVRQLLINSLDKSLSNKYATKDKIQYISTSIISKINKAILKMNASTNSNAKKITAILENLKTYYSDKLISLSNQLKNETTIKTPTGAKSMDEAKSNMANQGGIGADPYVTEQNMKTGDYTKEQRLKALEDEYGVKSGQVSREEMIEKMMIKDGVTQKNAEKNLDSFVRNTGFEVKE